MLLGSPPDMVHSTLLHRVCPHNRKHFSISHNIIQHFTEKIKGVLEFFIKRNPSQLKTGFLRGKPLLDPVFAARG